MNKFEIRIKRILFAKKHYKFLKKNWGIKFPFLNAIFGNINHCTK